MDYTMMSGDRGARRAASPNCDTDDGWSWRRCNGEVIVAQPDGRECRTTCEGVPGLLGGYDQVDLKPGNELSITAMAEKVNATRPPLIAKMRAGGV